MKIFMSLMEYSERCEKADFNYQKRENFNEWLEGHREYTKLIELSYQSPLHRNMWEEYKKKGD